MSTDTPQTTETTARKADGPIDEGPTDRVEALADAWASIDGRLDRFRANKADRRLDDTDGSYPGYMIEAEEMIRRLEKRGFVVLAKEAVDG